MRTIIINEKEFEFAGTFGVDAGLCWIGDPCYCVTSDATEHPAKTWKEFCDKLSESEKDGVMEWNYKMGHAGLGVSVGTGYGDGCYPVYVYREHGRVMSVFIDFGSEAFDIFKEDED